MGNRSSRHCVDDVRRQHAQREEQFRAELVNQNTRHMAVVRGLEDSIFDIRKRMEEQQEQLEKPVTERRAKVDFVNNLRLPIRQTDSLLLLGEKGTGKTTFMWLLGAGLQPQQTFSDGTVEILHIQSYVDSIGILGWTLDELLKLLVLMIYEGIPKDFIMFCNDRIEHAVTALGLLGINHPLIVIMSGDFWKHYTRGKIHTQKNLDDIYNLDAYKGIEKLNLGTPLTHLDDINKKVRERAEAGVSPFKSLMSTINETFQADLEFNPESNIKELLFRYIFIFEKVYEKDKLRFMNYAKLSEFK